MRKRRFSATIALAALLGLSACGSSDTGTIAGAGSGSAASPTERPGSQPADPAGPNDTAIERRSPMAETRGPQFGACIEDVDLVAEPEDFLASAVDWVQVAEVHQATREPQGARWTFPATVVAAGGEPVDVRLHASYWPGIDWALEEQGEVWFAMADPAIYGADDLVAYVMVVAPDGSVFFPGECQEDNLRRPMVAQHGPETDRVLRETTGKVGAELRAAVRSGQPDAEVEPEMILNRETAPAELLDSMQFVVVHLRVPGGPGSKFTVCTKASEGWNDCVVADGGARDGLAVDGYVGDDGVLEVWLLNEHADTARPIRKLGEVVVPAELRGQPQIAMDIEVRGASNAAQARVRLAEVIPIEALDRMGWPGLADSGDTTVEVIEGPVEP